MVHVNIFIINYLFEGYIIRRMNLIYLMEDIMDEIWRRWRILKMVIMIY